MWANGVAYTNSTTVEPPPTGGPFSTLNVGNPGPLGMIWINDDSLSILASTASGTIGGHSVQSDLNLSFYNPDTTTGKINPGFYSYQLSVLKTHWDTVNAELAGLFTFSTVSSSYTILLSDTVIITSVNTYLASRQCLLTKRCQRQGRRYAQGFENLHEVKGGVVRMV